MFQTVENLKKPRATVPEAVSIQKPRLLSQNLDTEVFSDTEPTRSRGMGEDRNGITAKTVGELLEDEYARSILAETSTKPRSAAELVDRCDASSPTVYRRVERLEELNLLKSEQKLDPDGHHYRQFSARLEQVTIKLVDGSYQVSVDRAEEDAVERFTKIYEGLR
nr:helix-turn-helix domain-containing protein [Halobiforma haloterrestris]